MITNVSLTLVFKFLSFLNYMNTLQFSRRIGKISPHGLSVHNHRPGKFQKLVKRQCSRFVLSQVFNARFLCLASLVTKEVTMASRTNCTISRTSMHYDTAKFMGHEVSPRACS